MGRYTTRWVSLREAFRFIASHHRHHLPPQGGIVALGLWQGDRLVGVGVLGRPVSRELQSQGAVELTRACVLPDLPRIGPHASGAASALDSRMRRLAQALGFVRLVTYTLPEESGASLRADGWQSDLKLVGGGEWSRPSRERGVARHPTSPKVRWWARIKAQDNL
jgi:hypothetical protein